jgi:hypothetical protein
MEISADCDCSFIMLTPPRSYSHQPLTFTHGPALLQQVIVQLN